MKWKIKIIHVFKDVMKDLKEDAKLVIKINAQNAMILVD